MLPQGVVQPLWLLWVCTGEGSRTLRAQGATRRESAFCELTLRPASTCPSVNSYNHSESREERRSRTFAEFGRKHMKIDKKNVGQVSTNCATRGSVRFCGELFWKEKCTNPFILKEKNKPFWEIQSF